MNYSPLGYLYRQTAGKELKMTNITAVLKRYANPAKAKILQGFFKTGRGEYGEGDAFLGITVPQLRSIAKQHPNLPFSQLQRLLRSKVHEHRLVALLILVQLFQKAEKEKNTRAQREVVHFYLSNLQGVNNWDLVDLTAPQILGRYLLHRDKAVLYFFAHSHNVWKRRIAIISSFTFIRSGDFSHTFKITELLLRDKHDLVHKACGWMLREVGKRDEKALEKFLLIHCKKMPRTMLRYAVERFSTAKKEKYLHNS